MKNYEYTDARTSSHGNMQCGSCGKKITEGRYRVRQKSGGGDWWYVTQHETCSAEDHHWAEMDSLIARGKLRAQELSDACSAFKEKWGVLELDEYILS